jgi:hypothetical protein
LRARRAKARRTVSNVTPDVYRVEEEGCTTHL